MTPDFLAAIAGLLLSLAFSYIPGLRQWYEAQNGQIKSLVMLACLALAAGVLFALACADLQIWTAAPTCDEAGVKMLIELFIVALIANQSTYLSTRKIGK